MPLLRLQYNGDNQYTTKDKRNLLLTQEVIEKINNMSPSQWGGAQFVTQSEYDALPASKTSDGNLYIVVDSHIAFVPFSQLLDMTVEEALAVLNEHPLEYAQHYCDLWELDDCGYAPLEEWKRFGVFFFEYNARTVISFLDTNLTVQELMDEIEVSEEEAEAFLLNNGHWFVQEIPN